MLDSSACPPRRDDPPISVTCQVSSTSLGPTCVIRGSEECVALGDIIADRYEIRRWLGKGGAATVYQAWDRLLSCMIAMKIFRFDDGSDSGKIRRLVREVRLARRVRHPNVCSVFDIGCADGLWFLTMEEATGGSLRDDPRGPDEDELESAAVPRPWYRRVDDAAGLAAGLAAIHAAGIAHRDVTPRNVLRMSDGRLLLADFGLAQPDDEEISRHGGTLKYLAPEVALGGAADHRSDVWQLGLVMHELLFGARPQWRVRDDRFALEPLCAREAPAGANDVVELVAACLAWNPKGRPTAAAIDRALAEKHLASDGSRGGGWRRVVQFSRAVFSR